MLQSVVAIRVTKNIQTRDFLTIRTTQQQPINLDVLIDKNWTNEWTRVCLWCPSNYLPPSSVITSTVVAGPGPSGLNTCNDTRY